jgi:hypothetical protein
VNERRERLLSFLSNEGLEVHVRTQSDHPYYESPRLEVLGTVEALTQLQNKKEGVTDGFLFQGIAITNASP